MCLACTFIIQLLVWFLMKENFLNFIKQRNANFYTATGGFLLSLGCAYVGNYNFTTESEKITSADTLIAFILTSPHFGIILGGLFMALGASSNHLLQGELNTENERLKSRNLKFEQELSEVPLLKQRISKSQEDGLQLKVENYKLHEKQVETWLKGICKHIELDYESRVSIYYKDGSVFKLLARNSSNPLLKQFSRKDYPLDLGIVSKAWQYGKYEDKEIPEDEDAYLEYMQKKYQYSEEILYSIRMKSRTMLGLSIVDADDSIGVILFESKIKNAFDRDTIDAMERYCKDFQSYLAGFVRDCKVYEKRARPERTIENAQTHKNILEELGGKI